MCVRDHTASGCIISFEINFNEKKKKRKTLNEEVERNVWTVNGAEERETMHAAFRRGKLDRHMVRGLCFHFVVETCEGLFLLDFDATTDRRIFKWPWPIVYRPTTSTTTFVWQQEFDIFCFVSNDKWTASATWGPILIPFRSASCIS